MKRKRTVIGRILDVVRLLERQNIPFIEATGIMKHPLINLIKACSER